RNSSGDLVLNGAGASVVLRKPVVYQEIGGRRRQVSGDYRTLGRSTVGFKLAAYDRHNRLVIDPVLESISYSTYLGGLFAQGNGIAIDRSGNAYITGGTSG